MSDSHRSPAWMGKSAGSGEEVEGVLIREGRGFMGRAT